MPTLFRLGRLRVAIYTDDHMPEHVHVRGPGVEAVLVLNCPDGPVVLRKQYGFRSAELRAIIAEIEARLKDCCDQWSKIHAPD